MPVKGFGSFPALEELKQFSNRQERVWLLPDPWDPQMKVLDGAVTLKKIRGSWLLDLSFVSCFSRMSVKPPSRPYWGIASVVPFKSSLSACSRIGMVNIGVVFTSRSPCWLCGFWRRSKCCWSRRVSSFSPSLSAVSHIVAKALLWILECFNVEGPRVLESLSMVSNFSVHLVFGMLLLGVA